MAVARSTKTRTWKSLGTSLGGMPATAGASRVFYRCIETGELCYRWGGWLAGNYRDAGRGIGIEETGPGDWRPNGVEYPAHLFD